MATQWIHELNAGQGQLQLDNKGNYKRDYQRQFHALSNSRSESPLTILLTTAVDGNKLPQLGDLYRVGGAEDLFAKVTDTQAQRTSDAYLWEVTIKYTILDTGDGDKPKDQNPNDDSDPRNWMPTFSTSWIKKQRPCYIDALGNPLVNSCNVPFDPPVMVDNDCLQFHISRYETSPNWTQIAAFCNVINSKPLWGYKAGMLKCLPITCEIERIAGFNYAKKSYTIEAASGYTDANGFIDDWGSKPLDRGYTRLVDQNGNTPTSATPPASLKKIGITDFAGRNHQTPQLLNGAGQPIAPGGGPVWVAFDKAQPPPNGIKMCRMNGYLVDGYQVYPAKDFGDLALPDITRFDRWF